MYRLSKIILGIVLVLAAFSTIIVLWHTVMPDSVRWMRLDDVRSMAGIATMLDMMILGASIYCFVNKNPKNKRDYYDYD